MAETERNWRESQVCAGRSQKLGRVIEKGLNFLVFLKRYEMQNISEKAFHPECLEEMKFGGLERTSLGNSGNSLKWNAVLP